MACVNKMSKSPESHKLPQSFTSPWQSSTSCRAIVGCLLQWGHGASTSPLPPTEETLPPTRKSHIVLESPCPKSLSKAGLSWFGMKRKLPWRRCGESELGGSMAVDKPCKWSREGLRVVPWAEDKPGSADLEQSIGKPYVLLSSYTGLSVSAGFLLWFWVLQFIVRILSLTKSLFSAGHNSCQDICPFFFLLHHVFTQRENIYSFLNIFSNVSALWSWRTHTCELEKETFFSSSGQ